jgi:hypothetical protein
VSPCISPSLTLELNLIVVFHPDAVIFAHPAPSSPLPPSQGQVQSQPSSGAQAPPLSLYDHLSSNSLSTLERLLFHLLPYEPYTLVRRKSVDTITDIMNNSMRRGRPWHTLQAQVVRIRDKPAMVRKVDEWTVAIVSGCLVETGELPDANLNVWLEADVCLCIGFLVLGLRLIFLDYSLRRTRRTIRTCNGKAEYCRPCFNIYLACSPVITGS